MSAQAAAVALEFQQTSCGACGIAFCLENSFYLSRRRDGQLFSCPNGCRIGWSDNEVTRLKKQLDAERDRAARAERGRKWAESDAKGARISAGRANAARRRLEHRVNCGVCPHCRRSFKQLAAHIKTKHPAVAGRTTKG